MNDMSWDGTDGPDVFLMSRNFTIRRACIANDTVIRSSEVLNVGALWRVA
jgi:hypothetical protein